MSDQPKHLDDRPKYTSDKLKRRLAEISHRMGRASELHRARDPRSFLELQIDSAGDVPFLLSALETALEALEFYADDANVSEETAAHGELVREPNTVDGPGECYWEPDYGRRAHTALTKIANAVEGE